MKPFRLYADIQWPAWVKQTPCKTHSHSVVLDSPHGVIHTTIKRTIAACARHRIMKERIEYQESR